MSFERQEYQQQLYKISTILDEAILMNSENIKIASLVLYLIQTLSHSPPQLDLSLPEDSPHEVILWPEKSVEGSYALLEDFSAEVPDHREVIIPDANDVALLQYAAPSPLDSFEPPEDGEDNWHQDLSTSAGSLLLECGPEISINLEEEIIIEDFRDGLTQKFQMKRAKHKSISSKSEQAKLQKLENVKLRKKIREEIMNNNTRKKIIRDDKKRQMEDLLKECVRKKIEKPVTDKKKSKKNKEVQEKLNRENAKSKLIQSCVKIKELPADKLNALMEIDYDKDSEATRDVPRLPEGATSCPACDFQEEDRSTLALHYYLSHFPTHVCEVCQLVFHSVPRFKAHLATHIDNELTCKLCGKTYLLKNGLTQHMKTFHKKENLYHCGVCGRGFPANSTNLKHMLEEHGIPCRQYRCADCPKVFYTVQHHNLHLRRAHLPAARPHRCARCPRSFHTNYELTRHAASHSDEMPFQCEFCNKPFKFQKSIKRHQRQNCYKSKSQEE